MRDGEIDDILKNAAESHPGPDPAVLNRIAGSIRPNMSPVKPLPSARTLKLWLYFTALAVAIAIAAKLGFHGIEAMSVPQVLILVLLPVLMGFAAVLWTAEMIPGSKRRQAPLTLLAVTCLSLGAGFAVLFRDPVISPFVSPGLACLKAGLLTAVPVALAGWMILHRGFAVNLAGAAIAAATLAGLAGVTMLELHCSNFETWHVLVWHTAVIPASAALGLLLAKLVQIRRAHAHTR